MFVCVCVCFPYVPDTCHLVLIITIPRVRFFRVCLCVSVCVFPYVPDTYYLVYVESTCRLLNDYFGDPGNGLMCYKITSNHRRYDPCMPVGALRQIKQRASNFRAVQRQADSRSQCVYIPGTRVHMCNTSTYI